MNKPNNDNKAIQLSIVGNCGQIKITKNSAYSNSNNLNNLIKSSSNGDKLFRKIDSNNENQFPLMSSHIESSSHSNTSSTSSASASFPSQSNEKENLSIDKLTTGFSNNKISSAPLKQLKSAIQNIPQTSSHGQIQAPIKYGELVVLG